MKGQGRDSNYTCLFLFEAILLLYRTQISDTPVCDCGMDYESFSA